MQRNIDEPNCTKRSLYVWFRHLIFYWVVFCSACLHQTTRFNPMFPRPSECLLVSRNVFIRPTRQDVMSAPEGCMCDLLQVDKVRDAESVKHLMLRPLRRDEVTHVDENTIFQKIIPNKLLRRCWCADDTKPSLLFMGAKVNENKVNSNNNTHSTYAENCKTNTQLLWFIKRWIQTE